MWFGDSKKVTLREDLTRYHPHLVVGTTGVLLPNVKVGLYGSEDRFGAVRFDCCGARLDILLRSLDIEGAEAEAAERWRRLREELKTTTEAVLTVGPRGGFRSLSVRYTGLDGTPTGRGIGLKDEAERIMSVLKAHGIDVKRVVERS